MLGKINRIDGHHYRFIISLQLDNSLYWNVLEIVRIASVVAESSRPVNNNSLLVVKGLAENFADDGFRKYAEEDLLLHATVFENSPS